MILAASQMSQKDELLITGFIFLAISVIWLLVGFLFWPASQTQLRWGKGGRGAPVSRVGFLAWGLWFGVFGSALIFGGYGIISGPLVMLIAVAGFFALVAAGYYDNYRRR
jgi:hypothetical protein